MSVEKRALNLLAGNICYNCACRVNIAESIISDYDSPEIYLVALPDEEINVYPKIEDVCYKYGSSYVLDLDGTCENWVRKNYES